MLSTHVLIARPARIECLQTNPANVSFAAHAGDVIAALGLFNDSFTLGAVFEAKLALCFFERCIAARCNVSMIGTTQRVVVKVVAR